MIKFIFLVFVIFAITSCNPCRYVSKHSECFPPDTVKLINEVVHYEKIFITNDSIILDSVPCDPITETVIERKTLYRTRTIEKTDTIYKNHFTSTLNPINKKLEQECELLKNKLLKRNKLLAGLVLLIIILMFIRKLLK